MPSHRVVRPCTRPLLKNIHSAKCQEKADVCSVHLSGQAAVLIDHAPVEKLRTVICKGRRVTQLDVFSVLKRIIQADQWSFAPPVADAKLALLFCLVDRSHCRAMSQTVDDLGVDWVQYVMAAHVYLRLMKHRISPTKKQMISTLHELHEFSPAGKSLFF